MKKRRTGAKFWAPHCNIRSDHGNGALTSLRSPTFQLSPAPAKEPHNHNHNSTPQISLFQFCRATPPQVSKWTARLQNIYLESASTVMLVQRPPNWGELPPYPLRLVRSFRGVWIRCGAETRVCMKQTPGGRIPSSSNANRLPQNKKPCLQLSYPNQGRVS